MEAGFEIVAGTYEEFLLGYKLETTESGLQLVQSFATHAHTSSIRSVASMGPYLASGGADDKVIIHDMKARAENRVLMHHNGTVNCVAFAEEGSHVLSGGSDGALTITRTGNWQIEKHWPKAHQGSAVTYISVHPSSKLALTIGEDRTLRTWNLVKGRKAYVINLASKGAAHPLSVVWGPEGQHFSLTGYNEVSVWAVSNAAIKQVLKCPSKSICMVWITEQLTAVGLENGEIMLFNLESGKASNQQAHTQRVKAICYDNGFIYSASSSGHIKIWKLKIRKMELIEKYSVSTGCRITCITLVKKCDKMVKKEDTGENEVEEKNEMEDENVSSKKAKKRKNSEDEIEKSVKNCMPYVTVTVDKDESISENKSSSLNKKRRKKKKHQKSD